MYVKSSNFQLRVVVLAYERPDTIVETIDSVISQNYSSFEVLISDNSITDRVEELVKKQFPNVPYIRRRPSLNMFDHINLVMSEIDTEYFMMFHDDDVLLPGALERLMSNIAPENIAICGNGFILAESTKTNKLFNSNLKEDVSLLTPANLVERYLNGYRFINPFPGYIYRKTVADKISLGDSKYGKYSDVDFLIKILQLGTIKWLKEPTIFYRIHLSNDSRQIELETMKELCLTMSRIENVNKLLVDNYY